MTALDLMTLSSVETDPKHFLRVSENLMQQSIKKIEDQYLLYVLEAGIGYIYEGMSNNDRITVEKLYRKGYFQVLICTYKLCWELK